MTSLSRVTPSAVSEHCSELIGCPISRSLATCCVSLELRSLPFTGVTRHRRYYEPLRHPSTPGLSLTGVRLIITDHVTGLPVLRALSLCASRRQYPGAATGRRLAHVARSFQPSPKRLSGRPAHRPFRGLLRRSLTLRPAHSLCHLFVTRSSKASASSLPPCLLRSLPAGAFAGWGLHPLESAAFHGARRKRARGPG